MPFDVSPLPPPHDEPPVAGSPSVSTANAMTGRFGSSSVVQSTRHDVPVFVAATATGGCILVASPMNDAATAKAVASRMLFVIPTRTAPPGVRPDDRAGPTPDIGVPIQPAACVSAGRSVHSGARSVGVAASSAD